MNNWLNPWSLGFGAIKNNITKKIAQWG